MGDPVGVENLGTDPTKLQKSLPHLCATYLAAGTGESTVCAMCSGAGVDSQGLYSKRGQSGWQDVPWERRQWLSILHTLRQQRREQV